MKSPPEKRQPEPAAMLPVDGLLADSPEQIDLSKIRSFDSEPALKQVEKYGVFLWWSDRLPAWVHPEDIETARRLVPGYRIFRRQECEDAADREKGYSQLVYGKESFRAQPIVWLEVSPEGFEVGDRVEVKSEVGKRQPGVADIIQITWERNSKTIRYQLMSNDVVHVRHYSANELKHAVRLGGYLNSRQLTGVRGQLNENSE